MDALDRLEAIPGQFPAGDALDRIAAPAAGGDALDRMQLRQPTDEEMARPGLLDGYQQPVGNLLNRQPARPTMADPSMKDVPQSNYAQAQLQPQDAGTAQAAMAHERQQNLQSYAEGLPLSSEEFNSATGKSAAGATPGVPMPSLTLREQATGGQYIGPLIPGMAIMATGAFAPAAMAAYSMEEALKNGGVDPVTNAPKHPIEMAMQGGIGAILGGPAGQTILGRLAGFGGLGAVQASVQEMARQKQQSGEVTAAEFNNPEFWKGLTVAAVQGMLGAQGAPHEAPQMRRENLTYTGPEIMGQLETPRGQDPYNRPDARAPQGPAPISKELIEAGVYGNTMQPGAQGPRPTHYPPSIGPEAAPARAPEIQPRAQGIFDASATPEDMRGRQWAAGTQAQAALGEMQAARDKANTDHEAAVRASVEAENALRSKFPDEGVSPQYPAQRDELRQLSRAHQEAESNAKAARSALDEANATLEQAKRKAGQAQETPLPKLSPERQQRRLEAIKSMQDANLPPEQVRRLTEAMDLRPELYDLDSKAAPMNAQTESDLGLNVSRETSASKGAPRISLETVDFGEGSPLQGKFPQINDMPYEKKAELSRKMAAFVDPYASEVSGVRGRSVAPDAPPGLWESYPMRPNAQFEADATYEQIKRYAAAHGYLHQQDAVFVMKEHEGGQKIGVDIAFEGGRPSPEKLAQFWAELRKEAPEFAIGAMPTPEGILIAREESPAQAAEFEAKYGPAMERAAEVADLRMKANFATMDWELVQSGGWGGKDGGQGYLGRFPEAQQQRLRGVHPKYEEKLRGALSEQASGSRALLQEHDPSHRGSVGDGSGKPSELSRRYGIDPAAIAAKTPESEVSVYKAMGNKVAEGQDTQDALKIYPLHDIEHPEQKLAEWSAKTGWKFEIFGPDRETGVFRPADFSRSYPQKTAWIFSPWAEHGSFKDTPYTLFWRATHEIAHGMVNEAVTAKFGGPGKRAGALGVETVGRNGKPVPPLSLADGLRAIEWEHDTFKRQREILESDFGIKITDEQFRKENATNMADAMYRVLSGDFSDPGKRGLIPSAMSPDQALARAKEILRTRAQDLGMDMAETYGVKKPEAVLQKTNEDIKGAFIPSSQEKRGMVYLIKGKADASTVIHEWLGHGLEDRLRESHPDLIAEAGRLMAKDIGEAAVAGGSWMREGKEWFAQKVEQYFFEGKTDVPTLKPLFEYIRGYMQKIYAAVSGPMGKGITAEERAYFDKIFGGEHGNEKPPDIQGSPKNQKTKDTPPIPPNEPREPSENTSSKPKVQGERSLPNTLEANGLEGGSDRTYEVQHNSATAKAALAHVSKHGAESTANEIMSNEEYSADSMAKFGAVMQTWRMQSEKASPIERAELDFKAGALATEMAKRATSAGQFIQFISALGKYSRDGVVLYAGRVLDKWNKQNPSRKPVKLTAEKVSQLRESAGSLAKEAEVADVAKEAKAALDAAAGGEMSAEQISALRALRDRLLEKIGDTPAEKSLRERLPRPLLGSPKREDNLGELMAGKEKAALDRLRSRGLKPTKALLQTASKGLTPEDVTDLSEVFASRLAARGDRSVAAIRQNFVEAFGPEISPYLDKIAQAGAKKLSAARGEVSKLSGVAQRIEEILTPLLESPDVEAVDRAQTLLETSFQVFKELQGDAKLEASWDLQEALRSLAPSGLGQKIATTQYIAQLFNPKTTARNVISNELFYRLERLNKWVASPVDWAKSTLTGGERKVTFRTGGQGGYWKAFFQGAKSAARGVSPEGIESKWDLGAPAFKSKKNPLFWLERGMGVTLRATDYAAYTRAKNQTLGELAELAAMNRKVPSGQRAEFVKRWINNADEAAMEIADQYGRYVTFSDETRLSNAAQAFKSGLNKINPIYAAQRRKNPDAPAPKFGIGNIVINYPKTPANLIMRGIDYSPAGILRDMAYAAREFQTGQPVDERSLMLSLGRAITGTMGMTALGYYLADKGVLSGRSEKDKDARNFMADQTGERNFQVNVSALKRWALSFRDDQLNKRDGDKLVSYDWMQPMALNLSMAAEMQKALANKKSPVTGAIKGAESGLSAATSTLEEQPLLKGIADLFDKRKDLGEKISGLAESLPASFVPTFVNQIRQLKDNTKRETRAPTSLQRLYNNFAAKIPILSETLPAAYKTIGKDPKQVYQGNSNSLWNVFVNPAFIAKYHLDTEIAAIIGPYESEGRTSQFPFVAPKKLQYTEGRDKKSIELSGEDYSALQKSIAQNTVRAFQAIDYDALKAKSAENQEKEMADRVKKAWERSRVEFLKSKGIHFKP